MTFRDHLLSMDFGGAIFLKKFSKFTLMVKWDWNKQRSVPAFIIALATVSLQAMKAALINPAKSLKAD